MLKSLAPLSRSSTWRLLAQSSTKVAASAHSPFVLEFHRGLLTESGSKGTTMTRGKFLGSYRFSLRLLILLLKTACIDKRGQPGGTCLNVGCIPSKSLLNNSHFYHQILHETKRRGIEVGNVKLNIEQFLKAKDDTVTGQARGVELLFKQNKVDYFKGTGKILGPHEIEVMGNPGEPDALLKAKNIIIATGSEATPFPGLTMDNKKIVTSIEAIALEKVPKKMVVIGGGIIGLELGSVWSRLGSEVTVVEFQNAIGAGMDAEISKLTQRSLAKQGLKFKLSTMVLGAEIEGETVKVKVNAANGGMEETLNADVVLVAIGRRPYTEGLGHENIDLDVDERGRLVIDQEYRTKHPHIRVIGDVTFGAMLAHKAEEEGIAAVEYIKYGHGHVNYGVIPFVMYTFPEVAWVGMTEEQVKATGKPYNVGNETNLDTEGWVKFIADKETDRILGIHILGPNAGEMIAEGALAIEYGASSEDIARTCHPHPTLSEAFKEAAMATYSKAIHF
ncbi:hypothetical protein V1517DRAFT_316169 [Lipomyces orientalis]|uniref:Uncharacterized protein n=1 Tax=Lipomyces orientalis TaxID=1233043 RepID=A0ACC3TVD7_9ASCO